MTTTRTTTEWGVRPPRGPVESIDPQTANAAYLSPQQMAEVRARVTGGTVVRRTKTVSTTKWTEVLP